MPSYFPSKSWSGDSCFRKRWVRSHLENAPKLSGVVKSRVKGLSRQEPALPGSKEREEIELEQYSIEQCRSSTVGKQGSGANTLQRHFLKT